MMKKVMPTVTASIEIYFTNLPNSMERGVGGTSVSVITLAMSPMKVLSPTLITRHLPVPLFTSVP